MPRATTAVRQRTLSAATALLFGGGLALYQMTSMVLGPPQARQLHLSLSIPLVEPTDRAGPASSNVDLVIGALAPLLPPAAGRTPASRHHPTITRPAIVHIPSAAPHPSFPPIVKVPPTMQPPIDEEDD